MNAQNEANRLRARQLHEQGHTYEQIGRVFRPEGSSGAQKSLGNRLVNHEKALAEVNTYKDRNRSAIRTWDREYKRRPEIRGRCGGCGGLMGIGRTQDGTCATCLRLGKEESYRAVELAWEDGLLWREIAETMGWSMGYLSSTIDRMRKEGWNLPYRYPAYRRNPRRAAA